MPTVAAIYAAYEASARDGFREHLGASVIGHECDRHLWYTFRWARRAKHAGRLLRLFETGQLEEARLIRNLRAAGVTVMDLDPDSGRQWAVAACGGHFGGSADGVGIGLLEAPKTPHVLEFKTHRATSFAALKKHGLAKSKPQHLAQMQIYIRLLGLDRGLYLAVSKDTDELYSERIKLDPDLSNQLLNKAQRVINATRPPPKISDDPGFHVCKFCDHRDICHGQEMAARNCRTCLHSSPVENGKWECALWDWRLDRRRQLAGCAVDHRYIPELVPGEQVDVGAGDAVVYRMNDGSEWADVGRDLEFSAGSLPPEPATSTPQTRAAVEAQDGT